MRPPPLRRPSSRLRTALVRLPLALTATVTQTLLVGRLGLSPRESEIVVLVLQERTDIEIATTLGISRNTVHTYIERLYVTLGVRSKVGLAVVVLLLSLEC